MRQVSPDGPMYQAGTLSGNPLAMAAGLATLEALQQPGVYEGLEKTSEKLAKGLVKAAKAAGVAVQVQRAGSMLTPFFSDAPVTNYEEAGRCRTDRFAAFFGAMLDGGVALPPSQFEAWFVSTAHGKTELARTQKAAEAGFAAAASVG